MFLILESLTLKRPSCVRHTIGLALLIMPLCLSFPALSSDDGPQDENLGEENQHIARAVKEGSPKKADNIDLKEVVEQPLKVMETAPTSAPEPVDAAGPKTNEPSPNTLKAVQEPDTKGLHDGSFALDTTREVDAQVTPKATDEPATNTSILKKLAKELTGEASPPKNDALVLLNSEVQPGTSTRLSWSPNVGFMGISG